MTRQASGPNEHPSTPTFLQVYKMLSIYSLLKPPKTGNCKVLEQNTQQTITINDFKSTINIENVSERIEKIETLKKKLDSLIINDVDVDDIFDGNMYNYYKANVEDCVLYYICGYITKNLTKRIKCKDCLTVITGKYLYKNTSFL